MRYCGLPMKKNKSKIAALSAIYIFKIGPRAKKSDHPYCKVISSLNGAWFWQLQNDWRTPLCVRIRGAFKNNERKEKVNILFGNKTLAAHCSSPEIAFAERCPPVPKDMTNSNSGNESPSRMPETLNPFLAFSSEDLKGMDKVTNLRFDHISNLIFLSVCINCSHCWKFLLFWVVIKRVRLSLLGSWRHFVRWQFKQQLRGWHGCVCDLKERQLRVERGFHDRWISERAQKETGIWWRSRTGNNRRYFSCHFKGSHSWYSQNFLWSVHKYYNKIVYEAKVYDSFKS